MLDKVTDAIEAIANGQMIIVVDDEDRENEGDLLMAAEKVTPEAVNFMATYGRGLICVLFDSRVGRRTGARPHGAGIRRHIQDRLYRLC